MLSYRFAARLRSLSLLSVSLLSLNAYAQPSNLNASQTSSSGEVEVLKQSASSQQLGALLDEIWQYELSQFPSMAKSEGAKAVSLDRQFTDNSMDAMQARNKRFVAFRQSLEQLDTDALSSSENISLLMQKYRLDNYISQFTYQAYRVPITSETGFHSGIGRSLSNMQLKTTDDVIVYKQMLREFPEIFDNAIKYMNEGIANNHTQPQIVLQGYESTITAYAKDDLTNDNISEHPFFVPLNNAKEGVLNESDKAELKKLVMAANQVYLDFYQYFTKTYVPNAKQDIAAKNWPQGMAFYNNRIKHFTTTDLSAQEIHDIGLKEVARIRNEMQAIVDELIEKGEFSGDINAFIAFLRTDSRFYADTPKDLIMFASYVSKQMDARLPQLFYKMPRTPYGVEPVPDAIAPKYTTGRYVSPRSDDQPGYYWVNTYALDKRPLYAIPALTLHEAVPGHHFQISLAAEMEDLPNVRRSTYISAFGEGWGLYSEYLGLEVGIYEDPYDNFGRLSYEMWRACRLVVDTGMHVFGWSRQEALDYMLENTALSEHNVRTEIDRYISWPAQALSYKIGEIKIKELRAKAENELGDKFDLRAFHDALLANGSVPLFVLEQQMNEFIEKNR